MQLTNSQQTTVQKLFKAFINKDRHSFATLKAPTGSGKTFISSELVSRILEYQNSRDRKTVVVVATVSNADLPKQMARKLNNYIQYHQYQNYRVQHIHSPSKSKSNKSEDIPEFSLENNMVYVFGTSSFGKNTLFYQNKTLEIFINQLKHYQYDLIFIRDEAHIGKKELSKDLLKNFDETMKSAATFTLEMTATPKCDINFVEMTAKDLELDNQFLLKTKENKSKISEDSTNGEIIDDAIKKFKEVKKEYQKLQNIIINPAMLIQVSNQPSLIIDPEKHELFNKGLEMLESKLKKAGLIYLKYLESKPEVFGANVEPTLKYASQIDSHIDAIIFKVGPATGWDIPRANMLLQLRNVSSETLNTQTLGRIMRNPYPSLVKNNITDNYYLWSNFQKSTRDQATYRLKDEFKDLELPSGYIDEESVSFVKSKKDYLAEAKEYIKSKEFEIKLKDTAAFTSTSIVYDEYGTGLGTNIIPNHIYLKIHNIKKGRKLEESLHIIELKDVLHKVAIKHKVHFEIAKYVLLSLSAKLNEIKNHAAKWMKLNEPWKIKKTNKLIPYYSVWKDNNNLKKIETDWFENYGYLQVTGYEDEQFLDSRPELEFFKRFKSALKANKIKEGIEFFAKLPTLGSKVFFEYYNEDLGRISKSFVDFVVKYKGKIIFVEVKGYAEQDKNPEKTQMLLSAYKKYAFAEDNKNIDFAVFMYDGKTKNTILSCKIGDKWMKKTSFNNFIKDKFK